MNRLTPARLCLLLFLALTVMARAGTPARQPQRIVSMAPSVTEILFELGLGDRVVGVTRYCDYPPATTRIAEIGGYMDPNYEAIVSLEPDLVILLDSHRDALRELNKMDLETLVTPHETIADIHESIHRIGNTCGVQEAARAILNDVTRRVEAVRQAVGYGPRPRVLVSIERDTESGQVAGLYVAGRHTLYDEILGLAGGTNAIADTSVIYPQLSAEGVLQLNPDVIVDLVSYVRSDGSDDTIARAWEALHPVAAVRNGRVHVIVGTHALRPGPRYVRFLEELARILHPDAFDRVVPRD
jgi:iron complex transport system substrate-binding protein